MRMAESVHYNIRIRKRPWYAWLASALWLTAVFVFLEFGLGSVAEREPRAALIAFAVAVLILALGLIRWSFSLRKSRKVENDEPGGASETAETGDWNDTPRE